MLGVQANAQLTRVTAGTSRDDWGVPSELGEAKWTGEAPCRVVDRVYTAVSTGGGLDTAHRTQVYLQARLVDLDGSYLSIQPGDWLDVVQDGVAYHYVVRDWSDWGQRLLGSPSAVRIEVDRRPA